MLLNEHVYEIVSNFCTEIKNEQKNTELTTEIKRLVRFCLDDIRESASPADELVYGVIMRLQKLWALISDVEKESHPNLVHYYQALHSYLDRLYCDDEPPLEEHFSNEIDVFDDAFEQHLTQWAQP